MQLLLEYKSLAVNHKTMLTFFSLFVKCLKGDAYGIWVQNAHHLKILQNMTCSQSRPLERRTFNIFSPKRKGPVNISLSYIIRCYSSHRERTDEGTGEPEPLSPVLFLLREVSPGLSLSLDIRDKGFPL